MIALKIINWVSCKKFKLLYYLIQFNWVKWEFSFFRFCEGLFLLLISSFNKHKNKAEQNTFIITTRFIEIIVNLQKMYCIILEQTQFCWYLLIMSTLRYPINLIAKHINLYHLSFDLILYQFQRIHKNPKDYPHIVNIEKAKLIR